MKDISSREDVILLVNAFYSKVKKDPTIGYIFNDVMHVDWDTHLNRMYDFWGSILLGEMKYKGTIMAKHFEVNEQEPLLEKHFKAWVTLWEETVNSHFIGSNANEALRRAKLMAELLKFKMANYLR